MSGVKMTDRLLMTTVDMCIMIIQVYMPTTEHSEEEVVAM